MSVKPKKHLGQHFLTDKNMCQKIANQYSAHDGCLNVLEIGPGMGALTEALLKHPEHQLNVNVMDVDTESIDFLTANFPQLENKIHERDFLKLDLSSFTEGQQVGVVGNFPYNISSQIMFKCLEYRDIVPEITGMFQKEMAERLAEPPGSKRYGIISVLIQAFYDIEYLFTVDEHMFNPPPKVKSGVIRCTRNSRKSLPCDEKLFIQVVKLAFNQRRKTMRNSLKQLIQGKNISEEILSLRPEVLSVNEFIELTKMIDDSIN